MNMISNCDIVDNTHTARQGTATPNLDATGNSHASSDSGVVTNPAVVSNLDLIINHHAIANHRIVQSAPVNSSIGSNLNIIANFQSAQLRNSNPTIVFLCVTETITAQHGTTLNYTPLTNEHSVIDSDVGV